MLNFEHENLYYLQLFISTCNIFCKKQIKWSTKLALQLEYFVLCYVVVGKTDL